MLVDLHNHTPLCNHATGTPREYVQRALEQGCQVFGFADHAPMAFDERYRMGFDEMARYEGWVREAADEFAGRVEVTLGYEVDFIAGRGELLDERVTRNPRVDFLIGSVHFLGGWGFDNPEFIGGFAGRDTDELWREYFAAIEASAKCGKFDILGHIDLLKIFNHRPRTDIRVLARGAVAAIARAGVAVELNAAGFRKPCAELYPCDALLGMLAESGVAITLSSDAHAPEQVGANYERALAKAREFGFGEVVFFRQRERCRVKI